jgi:uncharacterized protein YegL
MNLNVTEIVVVLDESGSMGTIVGDTIGGFNAFVAEQKKIPGEAFLTLVTFHTTHRTVYDRLPIAQVPVLTAATYVPSGGTALNDAVACTIDTIGRRLAALPDVARPGKVVCVVITDGEENSSRTFTKADVLSRVKTQQEVYKWQFTFLGANIDAFQEGASYGFTRGATINYTHTGAGITRGLSSLTASMSAYRLDTTFDAAFSYKPSDNQVDLSSANLVSTSVGGSAVLQVP